MKTRRKPAGWWERHLGDAERAPSAEERLRRMEGEERRWHAEEMTRLAGALLRADEERFAAGPPPKDPRDRLEWMRLRLRRW